MPPVIESPQPPASADDDLSLALALADVADAVTCPGSGRWTCGSRPSRTSPRSATPTRPRSGRSGRCWSGGGRATRSSARSTARAARGARRWIVDPIDGTKNYVRGVPVWATLIALDGRRRGRTSAWSARRRWAGAGGRRAARAPGCRASAASRGTCTCPGSRRWPTRASRTRRCTGGARARRAGRAARAGPAGLADPRLRRLLAARAGRRGRRSTWRSSPRSRSGTWPRWRCWSRRPAAGSPTCAAGADPPAAAPCPATARCTTRCWRPFRGAADGNSLPGVDPAGVRSCRGDGPPGTARPDGRSRHAFDQRHDVGHPRRRRAGPRPPRRGHPRRLHPRRMGPAVQRRGDGPRDGQGHGPAGRHAVRPPHLAGLHHRMGPADRRQPVHHAHERGHQVRRLHHPGGRGRLAELDPAARRRRRHGGRAQGPARQRSSVVGSASLVRTLHAAGLIDHYTLLIHPLTLGSGTRLFEGPAPLIEFELTGSVTTTNGVIIAHYTRR